MRKHKIFDKIVVHNGLNKVTLPDPKRTVNLGSRKHKKDYLLLYCGYDCETTTVRTPKGWRAAVYIHQFSIAASDGVCHVYLLRTWAEILDLFERVQKYYKLGEDRKIIVFDANLGFEFSFLQHRLQWDEVFAKESREPLLAASGGIEFREALTISGGNLEYLAKSYCYTQKLVGNLDFKKPHNYTTALDTQEKAYCINDVVILSEFSYTIFKTEIIPKRYIPMTKTSILLRNVKKRLDIMSKNLDPYHLHEQAYYKLIDRAFPDERTYNAIFSYLFRGGYVHANAVYASVDIPECEQYDITSSYPGEILMSYCPISEFKEEPFTYSALKKKCCWMCCRFYNIRISTYHSIESENKIINHTGATWDNGRLVSAEMIEVMGGAVK